MAQYRFYVQRGGRPLNGVRIVHDPGICLEHGLECDFAHTLTATTMNGNAMLGMPGTGQAHWFRATWAGPPQTALDQQEFTSDFGGSRAMAIDF